MSFARLGLGALIAAASLYATAAHAAGSQSGTSGAEQTSASNKSSAPAHAKPRWASGDVKAIDAKALTLNNGEQLRLTKKTRFEEGGKSVSRDAVKPGERVKASYQARGKLAYADHVDIMSAGAKKAMKSSSGQQGTGSTAPASPNKTQ